MPTSTRWHVLTAVGQAAILTMFAPFTDTTSILTTCDVGEFDAALERATSDEWSLDSFPWYAVRLQPAAVSRLLLRGEHVLPTGTIYSSHARGPPSPEPVSFRKRADDARRGSASLTRAMSDAWIATLPSANRSERTPTRSYADGVAHREETR